jgi:uncharacterized Zn-binding protein involved in type VI secretion
MRNACRKDDSVDAVTDVGRGLLREGSNDVFINGRPAVRLCDGGYYPVLEKNGPDVWCYCTEGVVEVLINGQPAVGVGVQVMHTRARGLGVTSGGSSDVLYGGATMTMTDMARADADAMFDAAEEALTRWNADDRARLKRWFGDDSEEARQEMLERFRDARNRLRRAPLVPEDDPNPANVKRFRDEVYLGDAFWKNRDREDRAGTLFHEGKHLGEVGLDGDVYKNPDGTEMTPEQLQEWARNHPDDARDNGHSWQGYAEDLD